MFDRVSADRSACAYRLAQDGLAYLLPHMTKRVVPVPRDAFVAACVAGVLDSEAVDDAGVKGALDGLEMGAFVMRLDPAVLGGEEKAKGACLRGPSFCPSFLFRYGASSTGIHPSINHHTYN